MNNDKYDNQNEYPFYFNLEKIEEQKELLLFRHRYDQLLELLMDVESKYVQHRDSLPHTDWRFKHLQAYNMHSIIGTLDNLKPGESSERVIGYFEKTIFDWIEEVKSLKRNHEKLMKRNEGKVKDDSSEIEIEPIDDLNVLGHKIVLLEQLGVLDLIRNRFIEDEVQEINTEMARLFKVIMNLEDNETKTFRKTLSYVGTKDKRNPINDRSKKKVRRTLDDCGLKERPY